MDLPLRFSDPAVEQLKVKLLSLFKCVLALRENGGTWFWGCSDTRLPELDPVSRDCRSLNCGKFFNPPPPPPPPRPRPSPPPLLVL